MFFKCSHVRHLVVKGKMIKCLQVLKFIRLSIWKKRQIHCTCWLWSYNRPSKGGCYTGRQKAFDYMIWKLNCLYVYEWIFHVMQKLDIFHFKYFLFRKTNGLRLIVLRFGSIFFWYICFWLLICECLSHKSMQPPFFGG